jgi:hypothetical protein
LFLLISCGGETPKKINVDSPIKKIETPIQVYNKEMVEKPLIFSVQIGAFSKENQKFLAIDNVIISNENGLFIYRLGSFETYKEARVSRRKLRNTYRGAFVQAVKGDNRVDIKSALKSK